MPVYPIEISEKLAQLLPMTMADSGIISAPETTNQVGTGDIESLWIQAILAVESGEKDISHELLSNIVLNNTDAIQTTNQADELGKLEQIVIASHAELLLLKPMAYSADKKLIKLLTKIPQQLPERRLKARLSHALAIVMLWRRDNKRALEFLFQSRDIYNQLGEQLGEAIIADTLGNLFSSIADHQQALLCYSESLAIKTQLADRKGRAITLGNLARLCLQLGRYRQAKKFAKLDLELCEYETASVKARVINLLARINSAAGQWQDAKEYLYQAIKLYDNLDVEGLFFCHKDLLVLKIEQGQPLTLEELKPLKEYLNNLSPYHQLHYEILRHKIEYATNNLDFDHAEKTMMAIQSKNIPELELEFRIWLSSVAFDTNRGALASNQLLLARKQARNFGFRRFMTNINSLMLQYDVHENIVEENHRPIAENIETVDDGYLIRRELGKGGFGNVYLAHDMINDRDVALKQFHFRDHWDHNEFQNKWNQVRIEFEAVARIKHPAVAKSYALGHDSFGTPYLVQEYLPGGELRSLMQTPQTLEQVLPYLIPIVKGLAAIHQAGVIHRDLKPENILINAQGMPVIVDFGIALLKQLPTDNERIGGTPEYMAPEQLESTAIDHRVDFYSVGCILFEWISGNLPSDSIQASNGSITPKKGLLAKWLTGSNQPKIDASIFAEATDLLESLLNKNPAKRPKDANELLLKLQALRN